MHKLQERLAQTEAQMTQILLAMQSVTTKMGDINTPAGPGAATAAAAEGNNSASSHPDTDKQASGDSGKDTSVDKVCKICRNIESSFGLLEYNYYHVKKLPLCKHLITPYSA